MIRGLTLTALLIIASTGPALATFSRPNADVARIESIVPSAGGDSLFGTIRFSENGNIELHDKADLSQADGSVEKQENISSFTVPER